MKDVLKFNQFFLLKVVALSCFIMTSCEENNNESADIPTPTPSPETPVVKLSEVTIKPTDGNPYNTKYYYNAKNQISSIYAERSSSFDGSAVTMTFSWNPFSLDFNGHKTVATISPNNFITSIYSVFDPSETQSFEYDASGHLVKWIIKCSEPDYNFLSENTFHWQNDLLTYREEIWHEQNYSGRETYEITYSDKKNISGVYPASFYETGIIWLKLNDYYDYDCSSVISAGLLGNAPSYLPLAITHTEYDDSYTSVHIYKINSDLNTNGLLFKESIDEYYRTNTGSSDYISNTSIVYSYR